MGERIIPAKELAMADQHRQPTAHSRSATGIARTLLILLALPLTLALVARAQSPKEEAKPSPTAQLRVELTGSDKKPIVDASVYLKYTEDKLLRDKKIEYNLKTNQNGVARSPQIPKGRVLIQIVSPGWKTFGQYYDITENERTIQITLERPNNRWLEN
jgi:hypothetical protein